MSRLIVLDRIFQILRFYRTSQVGLRVVSSLRERVSPSTYRLTQTPSHVLLDESADECLRRLALIRRPHKTPPTRKELANGELTMLNAPCVLGVDAKGIRWSQAVELGRTHLWRFHLHYHEYLLDGACGVWQPPGDSGRTVPAEAGIANDAVSLADVQKCVASWIDSHPLDEARPSMDAWHPYVISRRLPAWLLMLAGSAELKEEGSLSETRARTSQGVGEDAGEEAGVDDGGWLNACYVQAHFLAQHIEYGLGGNHLLENATALAMAALALEPDSLPDVEEPKRWIATALQILEKGLDEQVLSHGEHFERTPTYHCQLLGNLLIVVALVDATGRYPRLGKICRATATSMLDFVGRTLHADGEIPLFADSAVGEAWTIAEIRDMARLNGLEMPGTIEQGTDCVGPYWISSSDRDRLIFDAGQAMSDPLPGHGHCDLLTFVGSVEGNRWFVDSGVYDYEDSPMRAYCRSSVGHNVTTIDDRNHCDVWSKFRMGYRGHTSKLNSGRTEDGFDFAFASHNAYRRWNVPRVYRVMLTNPKGSWICLDYAPRNSEQRFSGRLHLAPSLTIKDINRESTQNLTIRDDVHVRQLHFSKNAKLESAKGWYCPEFGKKMNKEVICYTAPDTIAGMGWVFSEADCDVQLEIDELAAHWTIDGKCGSFTWSRLWG